MNDGFGEVDQLDAALLGVAAEQLEGLLVVDGVGRHQDAFGSFDHGAPGECAFEVAKLGKARSTMSSVDCSSSEVVLDAVGEDAAPGSLVEEGGSLLWRRAMTGQAASWTILVISSSGPASAGGDERDLGLGCGRSSVDG